MVINFEGHTFLAFTDISGFEERMNDPEIDPEIIPRIFQFVRERQKERKNYYFYWMVEKPSEIPKFQKKYEALCRREEYKEMKKILERYSSNPHNST